MAVEWTTTIEGRNEFGDNCRRHQLTLVGLDTIRTFDPVVTRISVSNSPIADRLGRDEMTDLGSEAVRPPQGHDLR